MLAMLFLMTPSAALAHTPTDPGFLSPDPHKQWKTLATPHFRIHYEEAHWRYAQQMGLIAERVHDKLTAWIGWQPREQTEIVVLDSVDYSNGAATVLPYNQFYIYMPTPAEGEIMDQNPWMEYVFTHEYVHILHLDMASGVPKVMRYILGRPFELATAVTFPQIFAPSWVTEGLAVYGESDNAAGYGRLNNAWYEAEMRMEVQRGLRSLTELSFEGYSGSRWPYGLNYLYGAYFFKFISERYDRDIVVDYIRVYGGNLIPWRMGKRSMQIFSKPAEQVWGEFQDYLRQRFKPLPSGSQGEGGAVSKEVYGQPYINNSLAGARNGDLYYYHNDASSRPQIRRIRADGTNELLLETENVVGLDWNDAAGLLINKMEVCDNVRLYVELYRWKPGMSSAERLTRCGRYARAAWRPDGQQIAAVQLEQGSSRLVLLDAHAAHPEQLDQLPLGDSIGHIDWSPDQTLLVASVKRQHTGWNLELFDLKERRWRPLTLNGDREIRPHFSRDGRAVYFISDHDRVWNLRRIRLADDAIETLSDTGSGVYEAVAMPDGSYRLVEYAARGMAIKALTPGVYARYAAFSAKPPRVDAMADAESPHPPSPDDVQDYSPLSTLRPHSWVPFATVAPNQTSFYGAALYGADVLGFHQWSALPFVYSDLYALGGYAAYRYINTLTLSADRQIFALGGSVDAPQYHSDERHYQALLHHSFNSTEGSVYLAGGISGAYTKISLAQDGSTYSVYQDVLAGMVARYDDTERYRRSISPTDGRRVQISSESYDVAGNSWHSGKARQLDWREYIDLGANHVLYLRLLRGDGDDGIRPYSLGGETETLAALSGSADLGRRRFALRGYPAGLAALTGTQMGLLTAEWRIPLGMRYDGWFVPPLGLGRHSLSVFVDSGDAWNQGETMQRKTGAGLAWNGEVLLGYDLLHLGVTVGVAHGYDPGGDNRMYLLMGLPL